MEQNSIILVILFIYLCIMIGIGLWSSKKASTGISGFLQANNSMGPLFIMGTVAATFFGGFVWTGYAGYGYQQGISAVWMPFSNFPGLAIFGLFFATKLRRMQVYTPMDLLDARFGKGMRIPGAVGFGLFCLSYVTIQFITVANSLEAMMGWNFWTGYIVAFLVITIYCMFGGLYAVIYTDLIQFFMLSIGCIALFISCYLHVGGTDGLRMTLTDPGMWNPVNMGLWTIIALFLTNTPTQALMPPEFCQRTVAAKDEKSTFLGFLGFLLILSFWFLPILTGICGNSILGEGYAPGSVVARLMLTLWNPFVAGLFIAALLAAIMSSGDSFLNCAVSYVARDVYQRLINPNATEKQLVRVCRWGTLALSVIAFLFGVLFSDIYVLYYLGGAMKAACIPLIFCAWFIKRTSPKAGVISIWGGILVTGIYRLFFQSMIGIPEVLFGLGTSTVLLIVLSFVMPAAPKHRAVAYYQKLCASTEYVELDSLLAELDAQDAANNGVAV